MKEAVVRLRCASGVADHECPGSRTGLEVAGEDSLPLASEGLGKSWRGLAPKLHFTTAAWKLRERADPI